MILCPVIFFVVLAAFIIGGLTIAIREVYCPRYGDLAIFGGAAITFIATLIMTLAAGFYFLPLP